MSTPPLPGRANLHNALALALGRRTQESDTALIEAVYALRRRLDRAQMNEGLFAAFEAEVST